MIFGTPFDKAIIAFTLATIGLAGAVVLTGHTKAPLEELALEAQSASTIGTVLESVNSEYNNIFVSQQGLHRYLTFGHRDNQYYESAYNTAAPEELTIPYTRYMTVSLIYPEKLERGLIVGFGGGRTASYVLTTIPDFRMDAVELDSEVVGLAKKYFDVVENEQLEIHIEDGRVFLSQSDARYDVIFLDAYRGSFVPFHLVTTEFYSLVKERLDEGGVAVQNVDPTTIDLNTTIATMRSVFPNIDVYPINGSIVLVGYSGPPFSKEALAKKAEAFDAKYQPKYPTKTILLSGRTAPSTPQSRVLTDDFAPVEIAPAIELHNKKRE